MNAPPSALNLFGNPIFRRYRRSQMRPVRLGVTVVLTLVIAGFIATMTYLPLRFRWGFSEVNAARAMFLPLLILQLVVLAVFGTAAIGAGVLRESEEGMIEYQRLTPLSPLAKVLGYLFGLPVRQYAAFGVTALFTGFSIVVGRIPFEAWGSVYLVLFTSTLLCHLLGLITGLVIKSRWRAGLISIGLVLLMNVILPRVANFGFPMFSHLTIWPVVFDQLSFLSPDAREASTWTRALVGPDVPFWNWRISHLSFALLAQGSLILTFAVILVRRWRDEESHLLGKGYAVAWLLWLQLILIGNVLPLLEQGRVLIGLIPDRATLLGNVLSRVSNTVEARLFAVFYGVISFSLLLPIISCITPREPTQMAAFRRRKKFGQRYIPWLEDGATAAPWVWFAAIATGAAWALFVERLLGSRAFGGQSFPMEGWAVFIGIVFVAAAIFHFLLEAYGRRAAWLTLFLAGFIPFFTSLVLISIGPGWAETGRYLTGLSPWSAPWQPLQWLQQWDLSRAADARRTPDFGPFALFCAVQLLWCVALFVGWRRRRKLRESRA